MTPAWPVEITKKYGGKRMRRLVMILMCLFVFGMFGISQAFMGGDANYNLTAYEWEVVNSCDGKIVPEVFKRFICRNQVVLLDQVVDETITVRDNTWSVGDSSGAYEDVGGSYNFYSNGYLLFFVNQWGRGITYGAEYIIILQRLNTTECSDCSPRTSQ